METYALDEAVISEAFVQPQEEVTEPKAIVNETVSQPQEEAAEPETIVNETVPQPQEAVIEPEAIIKEAAPEEKQLNAAEKILLKYPRMYPFDDDEMQSCVRIEPQDIGQLPIDARSIANNSFLLHGYYSYRHLVLMKTADKIHPAYFIGVPGIYRNKDEFMAKMFGFELFKPMSCKEDMTGEFGYWCVPITDIVL